MLFIIDNGDVLIVVIFIVVGDLIKTIVVSVILLFILIMLFLFEDVNFYFISIIIIPFSHTICLSHSVV